MPLPQQRDPEATRRQLAPWLARRMPQARDLAITNLAPPAATGFSNDTLLFDLEWTEDGRARRRGMVVRIEPSGFTVFPAYDVGQQFRIMQRLGETTDVPVPPMYWLEERTAVLGARFFVMGRGEGRIPPDNPPYPAAGWLTEILPAAPSSTGRWRRSATPSRTSPGGSSSIGTTARGSGSSASRASRGGRRRSRATRSSWAVRSGTSTTTRCSPPSASPSSCAGSGSC